MANVPKDLKYAKTHEWVRVAGDIATVGITDHAQGALGDITYVQMPKVGATLQAGDTFGVVESVKAASDVYAPVAGEVIESNQEVLDDPSLVNSDPYGKGWLIKLKLAAGGVSGGLMDAEAYRLHIG